MARLLDKAWARASKGKADPFTSLVLTLPLFLVYHLGILVIDRRNGVDWVSDVAFALLDASVPAYVLTTLGLSAALVLALWLLQRSRKLKMTALAPVLLESVAWAIAMGLLVGFATTRLVGALAAGGSELVRMGPVEKIVMAAGAGFHEELAFRVVLFSGGALVLRKLLGMGGLGAHALAALGSALIFAAVHHIGPFGEPVTALALVFRTLAGLYLTAVYAARGFAVAVYAHALYDVLVFFGAG